MGSVEGTHYTSAAWTARTLPMNGRDSANDRDATKARPADPGRSPNTSSRVGGLHAAGIFYPFATQGVKLIGVEAEQVSPSQHAAHAPSAPGVGTVPPTSSSYDGQTQR